MVKMLHVAPDDLLLDAFRLGKIVYDSGFRPKHAISVWRGGTPIGQGVDAYFRGQGVTMHHTSIATSSYQGIGQQAETVVIKGLEHLTRSVCPEDGLLIIDDVYETGRTIESIVQVLRERARRNAPIDIRVAVVHRKHREGQYNELPVFSVRDINEDIWIDYPHELSDLVQDNDPDDSLIMSKSPDVHALLREEHFAPEEIHAESGTRWFTARELLIDSMKLGVNIARTAYEPDFLVALWPGGVTTGLAIHEVFKYFGRKQGRKIKTDHIALNTTSTHLSYRTNILGIDYLEERVQHHHQILVVDTTFSSGRVISDAINRLKEVLRRNLDLGKVRVASVYWNPDDTSTWTVRPFRLSPDYYLKKTDGYVVYPNMPFRLKNPRAELGALDPQLYDILYGD